MTDLQTAIEFGDAAAEYQAFGSSAIVTAAWGPRTLLKLTGEDRHKWLHNVCTNEIKALQPGSGCEVFFTNVKAKVLGHGFVFATDDALWIETVGGQEDVLFTHFDRYIITEDVEIHRLSDSYSQLFVAGPDTVSRLSDLCEVTADSLQPMCHTTASFGGIDVGLRRADVTCQPGVLVNCASCDLQRVWDCLTDKGFMPVGSAAFEARRIEAVFPFYGSDISDQQMAPEAGRNSVAISYKKGCYLGQEPIARLDAMGHTNKELRGIAFDADPGAAVGDVLKSAAGDKIGWLTSVAGVPGTDRAVALGYVKRSFMKDAAEVVANETVGTVFSRPA